MTYYDTKQAAVDPDNPSANEQILFSEHNQMVLDLRRKIHEIIVDITALGNDKILIYKTASSSFVMEPINTVVALADLTDVTISGVPADNEVLAYDSGSSDWINQTAAEAGLATVTGLAAYLPLAGGTMAGNLDMGDNQISGVDDIQAHDALGIRFRDNSATGVFVACYSGLSFMAFAEASMGTYKLTTLADPTSAQDASTKNYDDTHLFTKEAVTSFLDGYVPVYRTGSGKFEMEAGGGGSAGLPVVDTTLIVKGSADGTKQMRFEADGLTTGTTRVMTIPDKDMTLCGTDDALLLTGGTMAGTLHMGDYLIDDIDDLRAYDSGGILCRDYHGNSMIQLATPTYSVVLLDHMNAGYKDIMDIGRIFLTKTELTIASGVVTAIYSYHLIDTEADASTDDLDTILGGGDGQTLIIRAISSTKTVVCKDGPGNLQLEGDMSLDNAQDTLSLIYDGTNWLETSRSNNGA